MEINQPTVFDDDDLPAYRAGSLAELWANLDRLQASRELRAYLRAALKAPSRRVRSTPRSMSGRYPSKKLGVTIGFESATLELPTILALEHDPDVLFYLEQPPALTLKYKSNGRMRGYKQTPDFLVIRRDGIALIECKRLEFIHKRAVSNPELFVQADGRWSCPPAAAAAGEMGIAHELWTEAHFNAIELNNKVFLGDYLRADFDIPGYEAALANIKSAVNCLARATIQSILDKWPDTVTLDHVFLAIGRSEVALDWQASRISDSQGCWLYRDEETLRSYLACISSTDTQPRPLAPQVVLAEGRSVRWDGQVWRIRSIGTAQAMIEREGKIEQMPLDTLRSLAHQGHLTQVTQAAPQPVTDNYVDALIRRSRPKDLEAANRRLDLIRPYLQNRRARAPESRTVRRYLSDFKKAQKSHGNGFVGLIPRFGLSGHRAGRLIGAVVDLALAVAHEHLLNADNVRFKTGWGFLHERCVERGLPPPSLKWFTKFVRKMPAYQVARARGGDKLAYGLEPRIEATELSLAMTPDRAWQRAHIDHTPEDLVTIFPNSVDKAGCVWLTLMIDHHSRRVLAIHLTYDPPSYRSVMGVLRDCVRRWGRLPESIVLDGGKEFKGTWLQTLCAIYHVTLLYRPPGKPRYGSQIERLFGTTNTNLLHVLRGNTQLRKHVRQMTKAVDPNGLAVWTFSELHGLLEEYYFNEYDNLPHRELLYSPRSLFETSLALYGHHDIRLIPYDKNFIFNTCPTTSKGTARVQPDGVKINYLYYNSAKLQASLGKDVAVRYDPSNMGVAFAYAGGEWLRLTCTRHAKLVWGLTEKQLQEVSTEWRRRRSDVEKERLTDTTLIKFLKRVIAQQLLLVERRRAAEERQHAREAALLPADWEEDEEPFAYRAPVMSGTTIADDDGDSTEPEIVIKQLEDF